MACYSIHTTSSLSPNDYQRAITLGPSEVGSKLDLQSLAELSGFSEIIQIDVTDSFLLTCRSLIAARERRAAELRLEEGDGPFEEEQAKMRKVVEGVEAGLLERSLLVAANLE